MADFNVITPLSHLGLVAGNENSNAGVMVQDRRGLAIAQVFAKKGKTATIAKKLGISAKPCMATEHKDYSALPLSPGQWMLFSTTGSDGSFQRLLQKKIATSGYVSEQSHSRAIIRISGPRVLDVLAKECRLDLHPSVAGPGFCTQTTMAGVGVLIHKIDDSPTFDLVVFAGFADSFWRWIVQASAEFGVDQSWL